LISAIFSHHSAEYLPAIIASRLRITNTFYKRNRGEIMYTVCPREAGPRAFDLALRRRTSAR
jgi:hypothetical protein